RGCHASSGSPARRPAHRIVSRDQGLARVAGWHSDLQPGARCYPVATWRAYPHAGRIGTMTTGEMPKPTSATAPNPTAALRQGQKQVGLRLHRPPLLTNISAARWLLLAIVAASVYFFHGFLVP